nr:sensor histidine kinase [Roseateles koreensis]
MPPAVPSTPQAGRRPSLRLRLLRHVMLPLLLTWALGSAVALGVASFFTQRAFDRAMLDDALLLASRLEMRDGVPTLNISTADLNTVLFDQSESEYFAVLDPSGKLIAGHAGLQPPAGHTPSAEGSAEFLDLRFREQDVRAVVLTRDHPISARVVVALTTRSRSELLRRLFLFSIVPQVGLLLILAVWLRRVINRDLLPLANLQQELTQRDAADLAPLPAAVSLQAGSREVHDLAAAVNALFERLENGISAQREFAGNVAHELKTPLAGLRAAAEYGLAQRDPQLWREQLLAVLQSQQRASHLVDQLLALALADEASRAIRLQPVRLDECARDVLLQTLPLADRAGVELEASGLDAPVMVMADRGLLEGLLGNLLDNAMRYGRDAQGHGVISLSLARQGQFLALSVSDCGPGIEPEQRALLSGRWRQGSWAAKLGQGAGLGLSIVTRYAELMNARLVLESGVDGRGLRASVIFPAVI